MHGSQAPESFRSLLLRHRGRTGLIQRDLAARAGVSLRSVQDWEAGVSLPTAERLQALLRALLYAGGLTTGLEMSEARELWTAVLRAAPRMHTPFDDEWFAQLLAAHGSPAHEPPTSDTPVVVDPAEPSATGADRAQDWGEAPDTTGFVGRSEEMALLSQWVLEERCRLVAVLGIGGIGKTILAGMLAQTAVRSFERVYWRSLRNAPPVSEWLVGAIAFLSDQLVVPGPSESGQITALLQLLRARRCLLVLDNSETLFEPGQRGVYRAGMDGYGRVLEAVGHTAHQGCLVLTSRESPPELTVLGRGVRALELHGLGVAEARALLADKQLSGDSQDWLSLVDRYGGNGLALKIVGETIRQVYQGDIAAFLQESVATYGSVFGGIRRLLDGQVERLSPMEQDVLTRLAVEREPVTLVEFIRDMAPIAGRGAVVEAIETLRRRSLIERGERAASFTLQTMVLEYSTDRLVETVADEIQTGEPKLLLALPLIKAQAKDYVRQTQERLIGAPILRRLNAQLSVAGTEGGLLRLLDAWRSRPPAEQGYGPGNVVNLLRLLRGDLRRLDLSRLSIRQAYLHEAEAQDASLAGSDLTGTVLAEAFGYAGAVALSADGALLAAATPTGEVRVWRVADRMPQLTLHGDSAAAWSVAFSGDARLVASGAVDGTVRLWEVGSGQPLFAQRGHTAGVRGVALSADGQLLASGSVDGTLKLWDVRSARARLTLKGHTGAIWAVAMSSAGLLVASGGDDGMIRLWDTGSGKLVRTLQGHTAGVWGVELSADGRLLASGSVDGTVRVWDMASGRLLNTLLGHTGGVCGIGISADGRLIASGSWDATARLWDAETGKLLATLQGHTGTVWRVAISGDGRLVASVGDDGTIRLWEAESAQRLATLRGHTGAVWGMALSRDGQMVASGGADPMVRLWDARTGRLLSTLAGHRGLVWAVELSADGRLLASGGVDGTVRLWEAGSGQPLFTLRGHTAGVRAVGISSDGQLVASGSEDETVRVWAATNGQLLSTMHGHTGVVWCVTLSGDGRLVASGGFDATVRLWSFDRLRMSGASSGQLLATLEGHTAGIRGVALSGDGRLLASASADGTVRLWEVPTGQPVATLQGHTAAVWAVAFSSDGHVLASSSWDATVRLWDVASRQLLATLQGHAGAVLGVGLSADGRLVASGGDDGTIRLWDANGGDCLRTLRGDRNYQRMDITGLTGVTEAQRAALLALGAIDTLA